MGMRQAVTASEEDSNFSAGSGASGYQKIDGGGMLEGRR
jgi:hypothetical protein